LIGWWYKMTIVDFLKYFFKKREHGFKVNVILDFNHKMFEKRLKVKYYWLALACILALNIIYHSSWVGFMIMDLDFGREEYGYPKYA